MEIDDIKTAWADLNKRLENTEVLNKRMLRELLNSRQQSAKDKLMRYEVCFLILCIIFTGFTPAVFFAGIYPLSVTVLFETIFVLAGLWQIYKIHLLQQMRLDSCSTTGLLQKAIRFKVITRMRTIVGLVLMVPLFFLLFLFEKEFMTTGMLTGMIIGACVGLSIGLLLFFRKLKDIDALVKSYKDLREFEAEE